GVRRGAAREARRHARQAAPGFQGPGADRAAVPLGVVVTYPQIRPRRLRRTAALRRAVAETRVQPAELVLPLFVKEGLTEPRPIASLPGVLQHSRESLRKVAAEAVAAGIGGIMLFGVPEKRDPNGSGATSPDGILNVALRDVVAEVGDDTVVMAD